MHKLKIYTSYFGNYKNIPQEYQCISIANSKPKGLNIPTWTDVVPNWNNVKEFKEQQITACEFIKRYISDLTYDSPLKHFDYLEKYEDKVEAVVLLCWEKSADFCHRTILADYLQTIGFDVEEYSTLATQSTQEHTFREILDIFKNIEVLQIKDE